MDDVSIVTDFSKVACKFFGKVFLLSSKKDVPWNDFRGGKI